MKLDPRQLLFREYYTNPLSKTFSNAYRSALEAGYSEEYAGAITNPSIGNEWVAEIMGDLERLKKAEKVLTKTLDMDPGDDANKMRVQTDVAKFVAKGLAKQKYSDRHELTGPDGKDLPTPILSLPNALQRDDSDEKDTRPH